MTTVDLSEPSAIARHGRSLLVWTLIGIGYATVLHLQIALPIVPALASALTYFYALALLMIPVRRWSATLLHTRRPFWQSALAHFGIGTGVLCVWSLVNLAFHRLAVGPDFWNQVYAGNWIFQLLSGCVIYIATVGITIASLAVARDRERIARQHALEVAARDAEMAALKAQFQPHFMLNALNSLLALIDRDPALARTMVVRLADLMKSVFDREHEALVPFERELDLVRAYLDIERIRLGSRLSVTFDIDDAARGVLVPPFLLQPVVENAIKHGVAPFARPGSVVISATTADRQLHVTVRDSGNAAERPRRRVTGTGRGLQITRSRLDGAFGDGYQMTFAPGDAGAAVDIRIPMERSSVA